MIPYGRHDVTQSDIDAVVSVLHSDELTQGPVVPRFEQAVADYCGARHAIAMNSATSALHVACMALRLGPGDWLWTSPVTFVASANCALYCGAEIDFVDIDSRTYNISVKALEAKLIEAQQSGRVPKVVVPVHLCGQPCEMEAIFELSRRFGFKIIEDASHAIGGRYRDEQVGNCRYSDIAVFSFHPVKIITAAEGGMALTNDLQLAKLMSLFRSHGTTRDASQMTHVPDGPWYYQQIELGYNYRLTDVHAALGLNQLQRINEYVARRHLLAKRYDDALAGLPLTTPLRRNDSYSALHLYVIRLRLAEITRSHREVFEALRSDGIGVNLHYIPVHLQPWYKRLGFQTGDFPEAERYYAEAISLPIFPAMTESEQDQVIASLTRNLIT